MKFSQIQELVGGIPFISPKNAYYLYNLVLTEKPRNILELGIAHGTATCYMAAALQEIGGGQITAVDLVAAKPIFRPSPEEQLAETGLEDFVRIFRMESSYTWFLHDEIKRHSTDNFCEPIYDLCIVDGPKNWTIDGCAFFLVDKLLRENGSIIFDDYLWTYAAADETRSATDGIAHRALSKDERELPHVKEIFELLVQQHPNYSEFNVFTDSDWVMARKVKSDTKMCKTRYVEDNMAVLARILRKVKKALAKPELAPASRTPDSPRGGGGADRLRSGI